MIKHIVMFKLKDNFETNEKISILKKLKMELEELPKNISEIKYFEVGLNFNESQRAYDFVLVSEFETKNDLEIYAKHKKHLEFIEFFKPFRENSIVVDYLM